MRLSCRAWIPGKIPRENHPASALCVSDPTECSAVGRALFQLEFSDFLPFLPAFSALEALINFAYNGHLAIDQQNVQSLLMGASFLQLQNIKDACCTFLRER